MTAFYVNMFNHNVMGQRSLEDVVGIFGHQLRALGHTALWDTNNNQFVQAESGVNIIVEGFVPGSINEIALQYSRGCRFIILATEEPIEGKGFNHGKEREMRERMEMFPRIAPYIEGILYLVPGKHVHDWYNRWAPSAYVELGYAPSLLRKHDHGKPVFDIGFYGSLTNRRYEILKRLTRKLGTQNAVNILASFPSQVERDNAMRNCKVIVQLRKYKEMGLVSSSRCNTALCIGRPVLAEPHDLSYPWNKVIDFSKTIEDFYRDAFLMRVNWRETWRRQFEAFQREFTPERCAGEPLQQIGFNFNHELPAKQRAAMAAAVAPAVVEAAEAA